MHVTCTCIHIANIAYTGLGEKVYIYPIAKLNPHLCFSLLIFLLLYMNIFTFQQTTSNTVLSQQTYCVTWINYVSMGIHIYMKASVDVNLFALNNIPVIGPGLVSMSPDRRRRRRRKRIMMLFLDHIFIRRFVRK